MVAAAAVTIVIVAGGESNSGCDSANSGGYAAQFGAVGTSAYLHLPQQIGVQQLLTTNEVPMQTNVPKLLPSSLATTLSTVAGNYYDASSSLGVSVDGV